MASAKALEMYSSSCADAVGRCAAEEVERGLRPGVGMLLGFPGVGIPETRPLPGVTDMRGH